MLEVLRNNSYRGGLACFGEVAWARVPVTRLLRGKFEVNWLELVRLGKTENTDEHGVRKFRTIRRQPESARWRREFVDKLTGDPFNPKPKSATVIGNGNLKVRRNPSATKPHEAETRRRATRWQNNDEVSADGIGEANGACNAVWELLRVRCSAKRCHQFWDDASR